MSFDGCGHADRYEHIFDQGFFTGFCMDLDGTLIKDRGSSESYGAHWKSRGRSESVVIGEGCRQEDNWLQIKVISRRDLTFDHFFQGMAELEEQLFQFGLGIDDFRYCRIIRSAFQR